MKKFIACIGLTATILAGIMSASAAPSYIDTQTKAHEIAETARSMGLPEDDPIIKRASELWWEANQQFCVDRDIIASVVYNESWYGCSTRHRELVATVVVNRVNSSMFPNSVYEVVVQKGQYLPAYANANSYYGQRARADATAWAECQRIATKALRGQIECPSNVLFQANFRQGKGVYETHYTSYSTSYFCYG